MTKLYYIYGGIRYSSALYKGEARGRRFCATQSTTRHLTKQIYGINCLGSVETDRALLSVSKTIESRLQTDFSRFFAVPQLNIERFFSNISHNHNHLELPKSKILQELLWIPLTQLLAQLVAEQVVGDAWLVKVAVDEADVGANPSKEGGEGTTLLTP